MMSVLISQGLVDESLRPPHKPEDHLSQEADRTSKSGSLTARLPELRDLWLQKQTCRSSALKDDRFF